MRSPRKAAAGLICLFALATAGCSAGGDDSSDAAPEAPSSSTPSAPSGTTSSTGYAPYVSATTANDLDSAGSPATYNLAFVISSGSGCTPEWNGSHAIDDSSVASRISDLTADGSSVRVSFGGASGDELAATCDSAEELAEAYGEALDAAGGATLADFDIEGDELTDSDSVDLRSEAIALLQEERTDLTVSFTLPVMPSGLDDDSVALLESANNHAVQVSTVNLMTMNYGESYDGDMGDYALTSAKAAHTQLKEIFGLSDANAWRGMALTSMIGVNDVDGETFTLADAAEVRTFAEEKEIAWVSMWSTFRDQQCDDDTDSSDAATDCSGVDQEAGAFGEAFAG
ncbi:chitinase [Streptomyces sp. ISL-12]|uniref:chitinase n=1 Tax=Streptomyces sp. ISL-12 TaxID=2819177 RepID=UPI001BE79B2D|nr:chitinase [Streptomyces sp. ISL-12]MBT2409780.1 chitinase [Streptomyces sp. ISL-12]